MSYRTYIIEWHPRTQAEWKTFTLARKEAANLWNDLVERHYRIRRRKLKWPDKSRWFKWGRKKYSNLQSQSTQNIIEDFCDSFSSVFQARKKGIQANYPYRKFKYRDVPYTNQQAIIKEDILVLSNVKAGKIKVKIPTKLPGKLMEVILCMGKILLIYEIDEEKVEQTKIGIDLGVNTLIAATDGNKAILISGREIKATLQLKNKRIASIQRSQSKLDRGSRYWKRLQRRKSKMLNRTNNKIRDLLHKSTHKVTKYFPGAKCYVGKAFNNLAQTLRGPQAQLVGQTSNGKIIRQLNYKTCGAIQVEEFYSSQTCPVCGERNKCSRIYRCKKCSTTAPRDVIGAVNILCIGLNSTLTPGRSVPNTVTFVHPSKYPRRINLGSSGGYPGNSSLNQTRT
jgi:putative transposase